MTQYTGQERRAGLEDRRTAVFDRRQFINIAWPPERNRRLAKEDRRKGVKNRRNDKHS